ncbi:hypothetical protein AAHC03_09316 [Spirometra sp. Aus1]
MVPTIFWTCLDCLNRPDIIDALQISLALVGMGLNMLALCMLLRLRGKTRTSLTMLRFVTLSNVMVIVADFADSVYPRPWSSGNEIFDWIVCFIWKTRFWSWTFTIAGAETLVFFIANRSMQIVCKYQFSFSTSLISELVYIFVFFVFGLLLAFPKVYLVKIDNGFCQCRQPKKDFTELMFVYAEIYLIFSAYFLLNVFILVVSCFNVIRYALQVPYEQQFDTLNNLAFPGDV